MKDISKKVSLLCSVCGNSQFTALDFEGKEFLEFSEAPIYKCSDCGREISREQLIEENQEMIDANLNDMKKEAVSELKKELKKSLGKLGKIR